MSDRAVRIANFSGYPGDRFTAIEEALAAALVTSGHRANQHDS